MKNRLKTDEQHVYNNLLNPHTSSWPLWSSLRICWPAVFSSDPDRYNITVSVQLPERMCVTIENCQDLVSVSVIDRPVNFFKSVVILTDEVGCLSAWVSKP